MIEQNTKRRFLILLSTVNTKDPHNVNEKARQRIERETDRECFEGIYCLICLVIASKFWNPRL